MRQRRIGGNCLGQRKRATGLRATDVPGADVDVVDGAEPAGVRKGRERVGLRAAAGDGYGVGEIRVEGALPLISSLTADERRYNLSKNKNLRTKPGNRE